MKYFMKTFLKEPHVSGFLPLQQGYLSEPRREERQCGRWVGTSSRPAGF